MNPTTASRGPQILQKEDWVTHYWFGPLQMVEVINPAWFPEGDGFVSKDYPFMVEMRHFFIAKGAHEELPGVIANVYLDGMSKLLAQNNDQLGFMADVNLKRLYYDQLIVGVRSLIQEHDAGPAYLKNVPTTIVPKAEEVAPWDSSQGERASDVARTAPVAAPTIAPPIPAPKPPSTPAEPEIREFEYEDSKYKMVVDKNGKTMYFKDGRQTSEADYSKAASM